MSSLKISSHLSKIGPPKCQTSFSSAFRINADTNTALKGSFDLLISFLGPNKQPYALKLHSLLKSSLHDLNPTSEKKKTIKLPKVLTQRNGEKWKHLGGV